MTSTELLLGGFVFATSFVSTLFGAVLGVGAVLIIVPVLYFVAPLLGFTLDFREISNLTTFSVVAATLRSITIYRGVGLIRGDVTRPLVIPGFLCAALGSFVAGHVSAGVIQVFFASASLVGAIIALLPYPKHLDDSERDLNVRPVLYASCASVVGFVGGLAGAGGGFVLIPLLLNILRLPTRIALGTAAVSGLVIATTSFLGRVAFVHIDWYLTIAIGLGAFSGSSVGTKIQLSLPTAVLRRAIVCVVAISALRMLIHVG